MGSQDRERALKEAEQAQIKLCAAIGAASELADKAQQLIRKAQTRRSERQQTAA